MAPRINQIKTDCLYEPTRLLKRYIRLLNKHLMQT